jgi:hypothetical protein
VGGVERDAESAANGVERTDAAEDGAEDADDTEDAVEVGAEVTDDGEDEVEDAVINAEGAGVAVTEVAVVASTYAAEVVDAVISSNATDVTDTAEVVNTGGSRG